LTRAQARRRYGGGWRFLVNVFTETIFFLLLSPIMWFAHTVFLATLVFGGSVGWGGQARDDHAVPVSLALAALWPQTVLGVLVFAGFAASGWTAILWAAPLAGGLLAAIPFCVLTADPRVGSWMRRRRLAAVPEEIGPGLAHTVAETSISSLRVPHRPADRPALDENETDRCAA